MAKRQPKPPMGKADVRFVVPCSEAEYDAVKARAGGEGIAGLIRRLLGLPPRKAGRPPTPKEPPKRKAGR